MLTRDKPMAERLSIETYSFLATEGVTEKLRWNGRDTMSVPANYKRLQLQGLEYA